MLPRGASSASFGSVVGAGGGVGGWSRPSKPGIKVFHGSKGENPKGLCCCWVGRERRGGACPAATTWSLKGWLAKRAPPRATLGGPIVKVPVRCACSAHSTVSV